VAEAKRDIDERDVEAKKPADRPGADQHKTGAGSQADKPQQQHQNKKAAWRQTAIRQQDALEKDAAQRLGGKLGGRIGAHDGANISPGAVAARHRAGLCRVARNCRRPRGSLHSVRMRRFSKREVAEFYRRLSASRPIPQTELEFINPFTLLVAVVLSAQATDVGVNKATPALFALADTPAKMLALGEEKLAGMIRTIGLYRTKARNVIALSRLLLEEHGGTVPRDREALETLPGVGRKTANVVLNVAFGEPTIAVDTHIFRVGNRTGLASGKTPREVENGLERITPAQYKQGAHHWLILHGRYVCKARKPRCPDCVVADLCRYGAKTPPAEMIAARAAAATAEPLVEAKPGRSRKPSKAPTPTLPRKRGRERQV